ncbi:unnamed protein product [Hermetia illucens]|uniref:DUF4729 domain-containing protein n=2 Tax=Hermetia illucens TaxID=343691 RepID=A0A7R8UH34_HERIL|nr:unnamed protein product [Hermetia illucens]
MAHTLSLDPNLDRLMQNKSSYINCKSRWEFEPDKPFEIDTDSDLSDSNTVIQHLTEFRKATNYTPPATVTAYKVRNAESFYEATIITTSKDRISSKISTTVPRSYTLPYPAHTMDARKVHVSTTTEKDSIVQPKHPLKTQMPAYENSEKRPQRIIEFSNSFSENIREKLKNEVYSSFDEGKLNPKNEFMIKGVQGDIPPQIRFYDATARGKDNFLSDTITAEIEKALKNLNLFPRIVHGSVRRDEIVRQSKCILRQRILEEVYSPFEDKSESSATDKTSDDKNLEQPDEIQTEKDEIQAADLPITESNNDKQVNNTKQIDDTIMDKARTIGTSTESYPKLNTDPSIAAVSKPNDKDAHFAEDAYIQEASEFAIPSPLEENSSNELNSEGSWRTSYNSPLSSTVDTRKSVKLNTLMNPIPILPNSDHTFPIKSGISFAKVSEPLYDIPEVNSDGEEFPEKVHENTVYYCQVEHTSQKESSPEQSRNGRPTSRPVAIQVGDYFESPSTNLGNIKDIRDFIRFLQKEYSNLRLKDLKNIIMNIPSDENTKKSVDFKLSRPKDEPNETSPIRFRVEDEMKIPPQSQPSQHLLKEINITASRAHFQLLADMFSILPQYKTLPATDNDIHTRKRSSEIPKAANLNIPRSPIICPISSCSKLVFVSEFSKHIKIDHERIPVECMAPSMHKNLFFDPKLGHYGFNKCHAMYLVIDRIKDLGSKDYKDYLPVLLMSTKISLADILRSEGKSRKRAIKNSDICLMIWLTGLTLPDLPIYYTLIAWCRKCKVPRCHIAHSGQIYPIRNKQDYRSVFKSGQFLLLRYEQWMLLSNNGNDLMELQIVIH